MDCLRSLTCLRGIHHRLGPVMRQVEMPGELTEKGRQVHCIEVLHRLTDPVMEQLSFWGKELLVDHVTSQCMAERVEGGPFCRLFTHQLQLHERLESRHQTSVIPHGQVCQQLNVEALSDHRGKREKRPCLLREPFKAGENGFADAAWHMQFRHGTATKTSTRSVLEDIAAGDQRLEEL